MNPIKSHWTDAFALLNFAMPMIISQGALALMIFTDRYFMSQHSPLHMAAALGGGITSFFCMSLFVGFIAYANAMTAQYFGAREYNKCSKVVTVSITIILICLPAIWVMSYFSAYFFSWMGHSPEQIQLETAYLYMLQAGAGFILIKEALACFFAGTNRTKVVMFADTIGVIINVPLSYIMINGVWGFPSLGIIGAGLSTLMSSFLVLLLYAAFYFSRSNRLFYAIADSFVIHKGILKRFIRLGLPSGIEMFLNVAAFNLFILLFQSLGVVEGAAAAIVFNWDIVSFVPMTGLAIAIVSMSGQRLGANNIQGISTVMKTGFGIGLTYSVILAVLFFVFKEPMIRMFIHNSADNEAIYTLAEHMMLGLIAYLVADAIILIAGAILRGTGDTRWLMITSITLHWLMLIVQLIMIKVLGLGSKEAWAVFVIMIITTAIIYLIRLSGRRWQRPGVREEVMREA